jgi:glucosamine-6-phosphate deaminase
MKPLSSFRVGKLTVKIYEDARALGDAAAAEVAERLEALAGQHREVGVIFATGASQMETLRALTSRNDVPWNQVVGFHMDDYIGISDQHPASFRRYLRERLTDLVPINRFYGIDGNKPNPEQVCHEYADLLRSYQPSICLLGIGENGHLAFNDPAEANFEDPLVAKIVSLDDVCREQQANEGWFGSAGEVPRQAITLTIPTLYRVPELICSVPGPRKAHIVKRSLYEAISTQCPATILRTHPKTTVYLDRASAAQLDSRSLGWEPRSG